MEREDFVGVEVGVKMTVCNELLDDEVERSERGGGRERTETGGEEGRTESSSIGMTELGTRGGDP